MVHLTLVSGLAYLPADGTGVTNWFGKRNIKTNILPKDARNRVGVDIGDVGLDVKTACFMRKSNGQVGILGNMTTRLQNAVNSGLCGM